MGKGASVYKLEFCMGVDLGNLGQSDSERVHDWFNFLAHRKS